MVDSGSTHNFLVDYVADRLGVLLTPLPGMKVTVANGDCVTSLGLHRGLRMIINDKLFHVDCYALPLEGFDVVLVARPRTNCVGFRPPHHVLLVARSLGRQRS